MRTAPPPHYTAFRIVLVAVLAATVLAGVLWVLADPPVLAALLRYLGLRWP